MTTPVGLLRLGSIKSYDSTRGTISVSLDLSSQLVLSQSDKLRTVQVPFSFYSNDGMFIGGYPTPGTPVVVGQGEGGKWYFVSFYMNNSQKLPKIAEGSLLIQASNSSKISLTAESLLLGSNNYNLTVNTSKKTSSFNIDSSLKFTQASLSVDGLIKRDIHPQYDTPDSEKLKSINFDKDLYSIGLDPKFATSISFETGVKNPTFAEKREIVYEFMREADIYDDLTEASLYNGVSVDKSKYTSPNRRESRADTLSLSLVAPNFLMETIKGTVVDIFGNILDINRAPIRIGVGDLSLKPSEKNNSNQDTFLKIKAMERNSVAVHFELNARKDLSSGKLPDVFSRANYARSRSRFSFDVNKEGLFKLNVPSSSETGSIPLAVRYENYSTFSSEDNNNPNQLIFREDNIDLFMDSFAYLGGTISIKDGSNDITPIDRLLGSDTHIKHGTVYHDILNTCSGFQSYDLLNNQYNPKALDLSTIPIYSKLVSDTIYVSGDNKNAGGRSGSINLDGSLELNIGANTVDKQSLWLDFQGGIVGNIGRDKNSVSAGLQMDGDFLIEIGGTDTGTLNDDRFQSLGSFRGGAFDIRVRNQGSQYTIIRIDNSGVTIISPSRITMSSNKEISIKSSSDIFINGEDVYIQDRLVDRRKSVSI